MTKKTNESESLGLMVARMRSNQVKRDWQKLSPAEKTAKLKKDQEDTKKRMAEGKNHTWKSEGHYTKDGKEWTGPQHAHNGQVMTGKKHTADSQNLYHYKELSAEIRKKVAKTIEEQNYTATQLRATKKELRRPKTIAKNQKDQLPATHGHSFVGSQTAYKPPKRLKHYDAKKVAARKGIERHLERKREKESKESCS